jgi:hypothetical protein
LFHCDDSGRPRCLAGIDLSVPVPLAVLPQQIRAVVVAVGRAHHGVDVIARGNA